MKRPQVTIAKGRVFDIYFESLYSAEANKPNPDPDRVFHVVVIADDAMDAINKTRAAFPNEKVNSVHEKDGGHFYDRYSVRTQTVVL